MSGEPPPRDPRKKTPAEPDPSADSRISDARPLPSTVHLIFPSRSYRVRRLSDNKVYALKETNVRNLSQQERQEAVNEIRLLASVQQNAAISGFHEAFIDGNRLCIVMEYAPFGDLSRALRKRQAQRKLLPEDLIWSYFIQIARGLQALHAQKILHRDVKTANVLRMSGEVVKLGDLGVAKLMKGAMTNTQIGTPHYMPPEVWRNRPYTFNSDVWALGCVLFEMCTFTVPFEARSMEELRFKVMKGKFPALPGVYSGDMQKMVRWLMIAEPSQRPNIDAVLDHPSVRRRQHLAPQPEPAGGVDAAAAKSQNAASAENPITLGTIKVPKNLRMLKKRLPAPSYPSDVAREARERKRERELELERERVAAEAEDREREERERRWREQRRDARSNLPPVGSEGSAASGGDGAQPRDVRRGEHARLSEHSRLSGAGDVRSDRDSSSGSSGGYSDRSRGRDRADRDEVSSSRQADVPARGANPNPRRIHQDARGREAAAAAERRRENIAALKAELSNIENVAPLHKAGDDSNNNLGNNYGNRVGAPPAPRGAYDHREAYNAAVQRVKLPLISGNGAVPQHHGRPRAVPGGGEYAPAAPLPGGRAAAASSYEEAKLGGREPGDILEGIRAERAAAAAVLARAGLVPAGRDRDRHGAARGMYHGGMGAAGVHGVAAGVARRVGLSNRPAAPSNAAPSNYGANYGQNRPARRPAPMARNFYF